MQHNIDFPSPPRRWHRSRWRLGCAIIFVIVLVGALAASVNQFQQPRFPLTPGTEAIVFNSGRDRAINVYAIRPDGTHETRLTNFRRRSPQWWIPSFLVPYGDLVTNRRPLPAPDGQGVVFISNFEGEDLLYQMRLDGTNLQRIVSPLGRNTAAVLSPNGQWVAYNTIDQELMVVARDGSRKHCITCAGLGTASTPAWAPDSRQLVVSLHQGAQQSLYQVNVDGTNPVRITNTPSVLDTDPAWSPDGRYIAFRSDRDGGLFNIYVMNADGSDPRRLTSEGGSQPVWSPDGKRIAFVSSYPTEAGGIYIINANGSNQTQLTFSASDAEPVWIRLPGETP